MMRCCADSSRRTAPFVGKPFAPDALAGRVQEILRR
jgi:hypothetical protein